MKKIKRILAMIMAAAMIMGLGMTAFAAAPTADDTTEASVTNVEEGAEVWAYQIVKANYSGGGFTGYSKVDDVTIANATAPTSEEVIDIAKQINNGTLSSLKKIQMTPGAETTTYTAQLNAGYWIAIVKGNVDEVYNPILIGVAYSASGTENTMTSTPISADTNWSLTGTNAYAKSSKPSITKEIVNKEQNGVAIGDKVDFKITTAIPSYTTQYKEVAVQISDTLTAGLTLDTETVAITVGDKPYSPGASELAKTSQGFTLTFPSAYALQNSGKEVVITYKATLNDQAGLNFDTNKNTAKITYSNDPTNASKTKEVTDVTYTYTFAIDAMLNGESGTGTQQTEEIRKVDAEGNVISTDTSTLPPEYEGKVVEVAEGAEFKLTNNGTKKEYNATSDKYGRLTFKGLDEGTYTLVETKAPTGYTLDATPHTVVISAEYNTNGTLKSYTIEIDGTATSTYKATYTGEDQIQTLTPTVTEKTDIKNSKLATLPSTGGIGTTIFTIGGIVIMVAAAALFFANRRKNNG